MSKFDPKPYLMDLKGKKYLQVAYRILWLNEEHPHFELNTELVNEQSWEGKNGIKVREAVFKATLSLFDAEGRIVKTVTGWGSETSSDFSDFREKAETKAIGRALALAGFGTQFALADFEEPEGVSPVDNQKGLRVVDSPLKPSPATEPQTQQPQPNSDEKEQIVQWLKIKSATNGQHIVSTIKEALQANRVAKVSDLPLEVLQSLKQTLENQIPS